jgi:hypothetical protein
MARSKKTSEPCEITGKYCCIYHQKNIIAIKAGSIFPLCNSGTNIHEGHWYLVKAEKEKTTKEIRAAYHAKRMRQSVNKGRKRDW